MALVFDQCWPIWIRISIFFKVLFAHHQYPQFCTILWDAMFPLRLYGEGLKACAGAYAYFISLKRGNEKIRVFTFPKHTCTTAVAAAIIMKKRLGQCLLRQSESSYQCLHTHIHTHTQWPHPCWTPHLQYSHGSLWLMCTGLWLTNSYYKWKVRHDLALLCKALSSLSALTESHISAGLVQYSHQRWDLQITESSCSTLRQNCFFVVQFMITKGKVLGFFGMCLKRESVWCFYWDTGMFSDAEVEAL